MINNQAITDITRELLEESFSNYFSKAKKETKHVVLDRLFPEQRRVSSVMSGLQTSLGTSFWEKLAIRLAKENHFTVLDNLKLTKPDTVPKDLSMAISEVKQKREDVGGELDEFKKKLNELYPLGHEHNVKYTKITKGKGADLILQKDEQTYLFDIKTVQVNANGGNSFNETLILWIAYYKYAFGIDAESINAMLVFPYNSSNELDDNGWWNDFGGRIAPLTKQDIMVGNQFWSFITDNTEAMNSIIKGINELTNNEEFISLYEQIFDCKDINQVKEFTDKVKLYKVSSKFNIELSNPPNPLNFRAKLEWKHNNLCIFKERLSKLIKERDYNCPICKSSLLKQI